MRSNPRTGISSPAADQGEGEASPPRMLLHALAHEQKLESKHI